MYLPETDYEKLLKFDFFINHDYDKFSENIQFAMEDYFGFPLTVYSIFNEESNGTSCVESIQSHSIYPDGLRAYQQGGFHDDLFCSRIHYTKQGSEQRNVHTIPDIATYEEFYNTSYGRYLKKINTPYQAVLRSVKPHGLPIHVLCVFKTQEQGEFNEYELLLLNWVGKIFSESVGRYKSHQAQRQFVEFLDYETRQPERRLAILDNTGNIVYRNSDFMQTAMECFDSQVEVSCVTGILDLLQKGNQGLSELAKPAVLHTGDYEIAITPHFTSLRGIQQKHFFCTILKRSRQEPVDPAVQRKQRLAEEYNFTLREAEIAELLVSGQSNTQIADNLCISIPTVKFHVQNVFQKLSVSNRTSAIAKLLN